MEVYTWVRCGRGPWNEDKGENNNDSSNVDSKFNTKLNQQRAIKSANTMQCDGDGHTRWCCWYDCKVRYGLVMSTSFASIQRRRWLWSYRTGWLLGRCISLRHPLVVLSMRYPLVILRQLVVVLPLIAQHSHSLVAPLFCPAWLPSNDAAAIERSRNCCHRRCYCRSRCHRHHRCWTNHSLLPKKEAAALPPPAYQQQHQCEKVNKSKWLGLI